MKSKYKFLVLFLCLFVLHSCKKDKEPLFGISIDTQKMVKTPAEIFSLQHIEFFRASNDFVLSILPSFMEKNDSLKTTRFAVSPFFLHFTLAKDSTFNEYLSGFENHYQLSAMSQKERTKFFNSFLESVSEIDSSIHIISEIKTSSVDSICVYQKFQFQTHYKDNGQALALHTTREKYLNTSGDFSCSDDTEHCLADIPLGNGNYVLTLIKPKQVSLKEYLLAFDEKKYAQLLQQAKTIKTNIVFPLMDIRQQSKQISIEDSTMKFYFSAPKKIILNCDFKIENIADNISSFEESLLNNSNQQPILFDEDFLFVLRGKNSNFIMFIGCYNLQTKQL